MSKSRKVTLEEEKEEMSTGLTGNIQPLSLDGNLSLNWSEWIQEFNIYLSATGYDSLSEQRKVSIFLHFIGKQSLKIFNSFNIDINKAKLEEVIILFSNYFIPKKNVTIERHKFFTRLQSVDESISEYVADLKNRSMSCEFDNLRESLIKDVLIFGLHNKWQQIKQNLLKEDGLTLDRAMEICTSIELSKQHMEDLVVGSKEENVLAIQARRESNQKRSDNRNQRKSSQSLTRYTNFKNTSNVQNNNTCTRCGQKHKYKCPAIGVKCNTCNRFNHFAKYCKSKAVRTVIESPTDNFFIGTINTNVNTVNNNVENNLVWLVDLYINNEILKCQIDTGAQVNIISINNFLKLNLKESLINKNIKVKLMSIHSKVIPAVGSCNIKCGYKNKFEDLVFYIVNFDCTTILGLPTCSKLNLIQRINYLSDSENFTLVSYKDIFEGLGSLPIKCHIHVDPSVQPIIDAPRKIPFSLYSQLSEELEIMCNNKVIEKVTKPTSWVSSIVLVVKKNKKLRICLDPRNLNKAIKRSHYPLPNFEVIKTQLSQANFFSTLDANSGFWMIPLDEESSNLCTFNTPFGRYKFCRLPYGLNCAPEIFHRIMTEMFSDIEGAIVYIDDIIVMGSTKEEHDERLKKVFGRAREMNLKFNKNKCKFGVTEVKFLGHVFNNQGVSPDPDKIKAIINMSSPNSVKELQRFLGMLNYLSSYIPNLADETASLRSLLKKDTTWLWDENYETIFKKVKQCITTPPVLAYFNPSLPIKLSVDASQFAVGAVIMQSNKPCAYASQSLNMTQQNYAQIEKELYAIVFGCQRFHQYLYGQTVQVETDHKPLVTLFNKPLHSVPIRLQRMMLKIQSYDLKVDYIPGKQLVLADTLSRAPLHDVDTNDLEEELVAHVKSFTENLAIEETQLEKIKKETANDLVLKKIIQVYLTGWPTNKNLVEDCLKPYWCYRDEINVIDNLVFKGHCLVIPHSLRSQMLNLIHEGHMGIERCRNQIKDVLFWPNITNDIKNIVESCEICMKYHKGNKREPMISHPIPDLPWQKLGVDFFHYNNKTYLLVVDYFSKYVEVTLLVNGSYAKVVISQLKTIFARFGIPLELISDNGPPYNSQEFKCFTSDWGIKHITTSPNYPQSNGLAERSIQTVKKLLKKAMDSGKDPHIALLQYRNTPKGKLCSPAQLLMSRNLRTKIPVTNSFLKPKLVNTDIYKNLIFNKNKNSKYYYNKKSKQLSDLVINDNILFKLKSDSDWSPGKIIKICNEPRSYIIQNDIGQKYRRNRKHIIKSAIKHNDYLLDNNVKTNKENNIFNKDLNTTVNRQPEINRYGRKIVKPKRYL
ncbi:uncharacterized protein K02A2.6-like [Daktulosphaira vitifoliae]|uniref:uncharacterized protein K02A2.6-like n=1 Tax=Daktulosphaira vitifoliae TaxID=58002 RepID=UPI0021AA0801|nr:uncharacterized protein K02A2.6-like [Daktulosphaira vitifoliae]